MNRTMVILVIVITGIFPRENFVQAADGEMDATDKVLVGTVVDNTVGLNKKLSSPALSLEGCPEALKLEGEICRADKSGDIAATVKAWHTLHQKMSQVTGGYGFSQQSAEEGGTGDYADFVAKERQSSKFGLEMEFRPCELNEAELEKAFDRYYQELKYIAKTFPGVGQGNLMQFPTCPGRLGANAARDTVVQMLGQIFSSEDETKHFLKSYASQPSLWNKTYKGQVDKFALPNCAEWVAPSIAALWYASQAMTIINMQGMARFPDWNKEAEVMEVASQIHTQLPDAFRTMEFSVDNGQTICRPDESSAR